MWTLEPFFLEIWIGLGNGGWQERIGSPSMNQGMHIQHGSLESLVKVGQNAYNLENIEAHGWADWVNIYCIHMEGAVLYLWKGAYGYIWIKVPNWSAMSRLDMELFSSFLGNCLFWGTSSEET